MLSIEGDSFSKKADRLLNEAEFYQLQQTLLKDPNAGDVVQGANGARKIRTGLQGRGKRGGARAVYFYRVSHEAIFFIALYSKNEQTDLSASDKKWIRDEIEKIKREVYP